MTQDDEESDDLEQFFMTGNFFTDSQTETTSEVYSNFFQHYDEMSTDKIYSSCVTSRYVYGYLLTQLRPYPGSSCSSLKSEGILIDTGAAKISTAENNQFLALKIDNLRASEAYITFDMGLS